MKICKILTEIYLVIGAIFNVADTILHLPEESIYLETPFSICLMNLVNIFLWPIYFIWKFLPEPEDDEDGV